jgi:hypothetical protein
MNKSPFELLGAAKELAKLDPKQINHAMLIDIATHVSPELDRLLGAKRSGFSYAGNLFVQLYADLVGASVPSVVEDLNTFCIDAGICFQSYTVETFTNGKTRRAIPDQPGMSRFLARVKAPTPETAQEFGNLVLLAIVLYARDADLLPSDVDIIADYHDEACEMDANDPYCFKTKKGKAVHRTLSFTVLGKDLHLSFQNYKIKKGEAKLPYFERVLALLREWGFNITYALLDRGFYRKALLEYLHGADVTVIMPARSCAGTRQKIKMWLLGRGKRVGTLYLKLRYIKKVGWKRLRMGVVLAGKRGYDMRKTKAQYRKGALPEAEAVRQIFPLLVVRARGKGARAITGNENYIRSLYRLRWQIEIQFRELRRIGIANWVQDRDKRLFRFDCKCVLYNLWQLARKRFTQGTDFTLKEFCGRILHNRAASDWTPLADIIA